MISIIFSGGGSGGHFYPLIAIARELKKIKTHNVKIYFTAPKNPDKKTLDKENITFVGIISGKLRRYFSFKNIISPLLIFIGFIQSLILIKHISPKLVFLKGGYGALPTGLAALFTGVPIFIHESDSIPGLMNRIFHKFAIISFTSFPQTFSSDKKVELVGNPVRQMKSSLTIQEAKKEFGFIQDNPIILIIGGSQGSNEINKLIFNLINQLKERFSLIHIVGKQNILSYKKKLSQTKNIKNYKNYKIYSFLNEKNLKNAYRAADLIIARSGSGTIFEIALNKKPSILIPLINSASNHQIENAYRYMQAGACIVAENPNENPQVFLDLLNQTINDNDKLKSMSIKAEKFSQPNSAVKIAKILNKYLS